MRTGFIVAACIVFVLGGCSADKPQIAADLNDALDVAAAAEVAYAARPTADPKTVAQLSGLLAAAQSAVTVWQASTKPEDQTIATSALTALMEYEASAGVTP